MFNVTVGPIHCRISFYSSFLHEDLIFVLLYTNIIYVFSVTPTRRSRDNKNVKSGWEGGGEIHKVLFSRPGLFNICRKALGHLMKFTQRSIPYRLAD